MSRSQVSYCLPLAFCLLVYSACSATYAPASSDAGTSGGDASQGDDAQVGQTEGGGDGCVPGSTASCYCPGAATGTETCQNSRAFGACECPTEEAGVGCTQPLCNGACCAASQLCVMDRSSGVYACADVCTTNSDCPAAACCSWSSFPGETAWNGQAVCLDARNNDGSCLCQNGSDCPGGACTPWQGFYTCLPNDGAAYHGCMGSTTCGSGFDCVQDCKGNEYCAAAAAQSCPGPTWCTVPTAICRNAVFSCSDDCMLCSCE
jgi:hypothetical protein